jgi:hypothetical protein
VERFNQTVAKYLASFVNSTTLDWELYLAPLAFSYNTSLHRTVKATPFSLTYGEEARQPSFPNPDIQRQYGESQPAEWYQRLQQARQLATQQSMKSVTRTESDYNKNATQHSYSVNQLVWLQEQNFLGKNRKIAMHWTGPYKIVKVFEFGVVDIAYKNKIYRVNMNRIKPYTEETFPTQQQIVPKHVPPPQQQHLQPFPRPQLQQQHFATRLNWEQERQLGEERREERHENEDRGEIRQQDEMIPPQVKRGRGRPRKIVLPANEANAAEAPIPEGGGVHEENVPDPNPRESLDEKRVTRSMTRTAAMNFPMEGITIADEERRVIPVKAIPRVQWRTAVGEGPPFVCDQFGLPLRTGSKELAEQIAARRRKLKSLSVEERNRTLTGDEGFQFDPTPYEVLWTHKQLGPQQQDQQQLQQEEIEQEDDIVEEEIIVDDPILEEEVHPTPPKQVRVRKTEAERLLADSPLRLPEGQLRSGKVWKTPPPPGMTPWSQQMRPPSQSSPSSSSSKSLGARFKEVAKSLTTIPPPPGSSRPAQTPTSGGAGPTMLDVLRKKDADRERLMNKVRQPQHLTDQFGPSRFPTMTTTQTEEQKKKDENKKKPP